MTTSADNLQCSMCKAPFAQGARFCIQCGAPVPSICGACGFSNVAHAHFCAACGAKLSARPYEASTTSAQGALVAGDAAAGSVERRQLTVLFCDLVGSTQLSSRLDPEELRDVIGAYHRCVADSVAPFAGFVARYMGDGALVYFGYPHGYEDNAERAVRAALATVANVRELQATGEPLRVRIGIASGLVVVGELVNVGAAREQTALGETPNLAARLQALAEPDTIVMSETTLRLVGELFDVADLGAVALKGFNDPVRAWKVVGARRAASRLAAYESTPRGPRDVHAGTEASSLVGREAELRTLEKVWQSVCDGTGHAVLLAGDAGIGKSRLVRALVSRLASQAHYELEFHCSPYYANSPLYPVVSLLPGVVGWSRSDADETKLDKLQAFCERNRMSMTEAFPLFASLASLPMPERFPLPPMSAERQKQRTLQMLLQIPLAFAAARPLLMVVEDVHWIDPTTMELLASLVDQLPAARVFVLFTARTPYRTLWPARAHVSSLLLTRLTRNESERMIERLTGGKALPAKLAAEIVAKTDGVPLFVEELTKMVLESDMLEERAGRYELASALPSLAIPATLHDSLTARLDRLGTAKRVVQIAAMLGRQFSYAMLSAVAELDESTLQRDVAKLVDAELLYPHGNGREPAYMFKHALIQEAAYQSLVRGTRRQYHRRIAEALVERFAPEAAAHPEIVAMHYTEAGAPDLALRWWQQAGQRAMQRASYAEAVTHYTKGLHVLDSMPATQARDHIELALQVDLGYALIPLKGWTAPDSAQAFTRAGELSQRIGDAPKLFRALWGVAAFHFVHGDQREARRLADQCLTMARAANDSDSLIEAYYMSGIATCAAGDFVGGRDQLEEAIRLHGDELRDIHLVQYAQDAKASALGWLAMALWVLGQPDEALERAYQALARVRNATQPFLLARALASVGFVHVFRGDPQGPNTELMKALQVCEEQGYTYFHAIVSAFAGMNLVHLGRTEEAITQIRTSVGRLRAVGSELLLTIVFVHLADAHRALEQVDQGLAAVADGLDCVERNGERWAESELHRVRGELLLLQRDADIGVAEACLTKALELSRAQQANAYRLRAATSLARLWAGQKRTADAERVLREAIAAYPEPGNSAELRAAQALHRSLG